MHNLPTTNLRLLDSSQPKPQGESSSMPDFLFAERSDVITTHQLNANRANKDDPKTAKFLTKYERGTATATLYIKNLHKSVVEKDLSFIFYRYASKPEVGNAEIKILYGGKKGRLRGQAFITFASVEQATRAIDEVHL
eukprot:CAMPEP_0168522174 /NCGR_PEP_ID=MMETSP0405-20121227/9158_1 /TAXON_ID=498012 /ORGANISM="Trichosphaerium sp, Strain Am-I-7 wt" /LENGTH=137 /DNA_ID=CAMNT_0008543661 /DNA_START=63 /DNA_END=473 /DNA_ORIENTATION=+